MQKAIVEKVRPEKDRLQTRSSVESRASSDYGEIFAAASSEQGWSQSQDSAMSSSTSPDAAALSYNRVASPANVSTRVCCITFEV